MTLQPSPGAKQNDNQACGKSKLTASVPELPRVRWGRHFEMHPIVFPVSAAFTVAAVVACFVVPNVQLRDGLTWVRAAIGTQFGWLYVASMTGFLTLCTWLANGPYRNVRLGRNDERPEFSRWSWFAMLFSAGMGIGLLFYSVAEPINHHLNPTPGFADGLNPSRLAMAVTIFHWGLHPWALYALVGMALGLAGFRHGLPLSFRSLLYPLLGDRVWGRCGDAIDVLAVLATLIGVATSLGIGARQINAGLTFLFGMPDDVWTQTFLIGGITTLATLSVVTGLKAGIRRLSELNMILATVLLLLVVGGGGLMATLAATVESTGAYLQVLPFNSFRTGAFSDESRDWLSDWTVFYWAWWISWSPFVGLFIARISRGRTVREFVLGVVLVPTAVAILWLTAFGQAAVQQEPYNQDRVDARQEDNSQIALPEFDVIVTDADGTLLKQGEKYVVERQPLTAMQYYEYSVANAEHTEPVDPLPTVLFVMLQGLFQMGWLSTLAITIATLCILLFFVTSSDSASMVIDIIASGGNPDPPVGTRLFWALAEGVVAAALLAAGGLVALQTAAIVAALPLLLLILAAVWGMLRTLRHEALEEPRKQHGSRSD